PAVVLLSATRLRLDHSNQSLTVTRVANGNNQAAAHSELRNQRLRNRWPTRSNEYSVVRSMCRPPKCSVKALDRCVVNLQLTNSRLCFAREIGDALDRVDLRCNA